MITVHSESGTHIVNIDSISGIYISNARGTVTLVTDGEDIDIEESAEDVIEMIEKERNRRRTAFTADLAGKLSSYGIGL